MGKFQSSSVQLSRSKSAPPSLKNNVETSQSRLAETSQEKCPAKSVRVSQPNSVKSSLTWSAPTFPNSSALSFPLKVADKNQKNNALQWNDSSVGRCQGSSARKVYQLMESSHTETAVTEVKISLLTLYY